MALVTIDQAREHCKSDTADDALLGVYLAAAEKSAARLVGRNLYATPEALNNAFSTIATKMSDARAAYDTAIAAAADLDEQGKMSAESLAQRELDKVTWEQHYVLHGIVADDDIKAAILLITGHLYRNREDVVTGVTATEVPNAARALLWPYTVIAAGLTL